MSPREREAYCSASCCVECVVLCRVGVVMVWESCGCGGWRWEYGFLATMSAGWR